MSERRAALDDRALPWKGQWRREPDPAYLAALGATRQEMTDHDATHRRIAEAGLRVIDAHASSCAEWDDYEERYASAIDRFVAAHPLDPDAREFAARIARWRETYARWGRDTLGFATFVVEPLAADARR